MFDPAQKTRSAYLAAAILLVLHTSDVVAAPAPSDTTAWDGPRVQALVRRAIEARRVVWSDTSLHNFEARVEAHIYFLAGLGTPDGGGGADEAPAAGERLIRADQLALRVRWRAPDESMQTIVGRRSQERLPTRIRYHIDHLSLELGNFGYHIQIGEGTEVRDVLHPIAPGALSFYHYRLVDSLGIETAERRTTLYVVEVRPREPDRPGVVGSVYLDGTTGAVARMRITFTPASYRDPSVAGITVDLRSALYDGRWWLPAEQWLDIRRQASWLSFPLTGVIRTHLEVRSLRVNVPDMPALPEGGRVVTLPPKRLHSYDDWSDGLYDDPAASRLRGTIGPDEVRSEARRLLGGGLLVPSSRFGPWIPSVSSALRIRRAEGVTVGLGLRYRLDDRRSLQLGAAWPFEAERPEWTVGYRGPAAGGRLEAHVFHRQLIDIGPFRAADGAVSTLGFLFSGEDFTDPYYRTGARLALSWPLAGGRLLVGGLAERDRSARVVAEPPGDEPIRPVRPVMPGDLGALELGWSRTVRGPLAGTLKARLDLRAASDAVGAFGFTRTTAILQGRSGPDLDPWAWEADVGLGLATGSPPPQALFLLGGRGTVPGYGFRAWGGDHAVFARLSVSHDLLGPWIRLRVLGAAGWAGWGSAGARAAALWRAGPPGDSITDSRGVRTSLGLGVGLVDDLIRVDAARGLDHGTWEWMVSVDPRFGRIL